jgi:hypothetical protein
VSRQFHRGDVTAAKSTREAGADVETIGLIVANSSDGGERLEVVAAMEFAGR